MELIGDKSACLTLRQKQIHGDLFEFSFSCEWCSGSFELFSLKENYEDLEKICALISRGKKKASWISEEGDLELKFSVQSSGLVQVTVVCNPSVKLQFPGKLEFLIDIDLASFDKL